MTHTEVEVTAARQLDAEERSALAESLPAALVGLLAVESGSALTMTIGSEALGGRGTIVIGIDSPESGQLASELAMELEPAFTTRVAPPRAEGSGRRWPLVAAPAMSAGFVASVRDLNTDLVLERADALAATVAKGAREWLRLAMEHPGLALEVAARFDESAPESRGFRITPTVRFDGEALPFRVRAAVREWFPGLRTADPDSLAATMVTDATGARSLLQLPIAATDTLPGFAIAPAQPVPMLPVMDELHASRVRLGSAVLPAGRTVDVCLTEAELSRHIHVLGQTGTGKSSLLTAIAVGLAENGNGMLVVDPHGTLSARLLADLPTHAQDRIWHIRAGDLENPVPMNPFAVDDGVQLDIVVQDMILIFYKLFDPKAQGIVGPRFEAFLTNALRGLRAVRGSRASLLDVPRVYRDKAAERAIARAVTDPQLMDFWRKEMPDMSSSTRSEVVGWFTSKFDRFANTAAMRGILGSGADAFDPATAMDYGRIILLDLSKGQVGEVASNLLGFLYLTRFWSSMQARNTTKPFGIIVDEAHSFSAGSLPSLLSEGRKWGASVTIAHQYISQLESDLADALSGNVATTAAFRSGVKDATELVARMGGGVTLSDLTMQPDLTALLSRTSGSAFPRPHTLVVDHADRVARRSVAKQRAFESSVRQRTLRDLVVPHRGLSAYEPLDEVAQPPRKPEPAQPSFLDDWLEKRSRAATAVREPDEEVG